MKPYEQRFPWQLDWNLLRTFMVVVEQRGISRAADSDRGGSRCVPEVHLDTVFG